MGENNLYIHNVDLDPQFYFAVCMHAYINFLNNIQKKTSGKQNNLCAHEHKLNATLKLRIDIDQINSNSNFSLYLLIN